MELLLMILELHVVAHDSSHRRLTLHSEINSVAVLVNCDSEKEVSFYSKIFA